MRQKFKHFIKKVKIWEECLLTKRILSCTREFSYYDDEIIFNNLQRIFSPLPEYGYDWYSLWQRGTQRVGKLFSIYPELRCGGCRILEIGAGDGVTSYFLDDYGHHVVLVDMDDWRHQCARGLHLVKSTLNEEPLPFSNGAFDCVISYNTFEHLSNPEYAFSEIYRICRNNGVIHLEFGPLYAGPWGLHAHRMLRMPYPQFLFSNQFIINKLDTIGIFDLGAKRQTLQPLNHWTVAQFSDLINNFKFVKKTILRCEVMDFLSVILQYPLAFQGRGLLLEDVITQGLTIILTK